MGTWGTDSFGNDMAWDFLGDFVDSDEAAKVKAVRDALSVAANADTPYIDHEFCGWESAIAAAEVVAACAGNPHPKLPESEVDCEAGMFAWSKVRGAGQSQLSNSSMRSLAIAALAKARDGSEIANLWDDAGPDDAAEWRAGIDDLMGRVG